MKFTKVSQHPHELLPKNKKRCEKKKKHATVRLFFHIFPLSETSPFKKTNKKGRCPKIRCEEWPSRWFLELQMRYPKLVSGSESDRPKMWEMGWESPGDGFGPKGGFNFQTKFLLSSPRKLEKMIQFDSYRISSDGWFSSPTKFGKSNDILEQL